MRILFLHGRHSVPGGVHPAYLTDHGHTVVVPALDDDFDAALAMAQAAFDKHRPAVIVGSSRGGAVAMNLDSGETPLVLLSPAWKSWGTARTVNPGTVILHSRDDAAIPFADSEELVASGGLASESLLEVGRDHLLADEALLSVLLLSPPGCGKSQFCKALGKEVGRPVLVLDVGSLLGSLVGQSEERTRQALRIIDAMAPCVAMIDEVEKAFAGVNGSGDSGVSSRMFGTFLSWLNDHESDVFVVCTANDVSRLPPEFGRSERFDGIFFLDLPGRPE